MPRRSKIPENQVWAALALLENDPLLFQDDIAGLLGISRTELRRQFERLVEDNIEQTPDIRRRVDAVRKRIAKRQLRQGHLSKTDISNIRIIQNNVPWMNLEEIAEMYGVARSTAYRSLMRNPEPDNTYIIDDKKLDVARLYLPMAAEALNQLYIPNDLSEIDRDLFLDLKKSITDLSASLDTKEKENANLQEENRDLKNQIEKLVPLWEEAWRRFLLNAADSAGTTVGKGAVFAAGFIAGSLLRNSSELPPHLSSPPLRRREGLSDQNTVPFIPLPLLGGEVR